MGYVQSLVLLVLLFAGCNKVIQNTDVPVQPVPSQPTPTPVPNLPTVLLPSSPAIVPKARDLIIEFEGFDHHPDWPQGSSGITVGVGYDTGYYKKSIIESDWVRLPDRTRLGDCSGITGTKAKAKLPTVRDIYIPTDTGTNVFDNVDVPREYDNCKRAFPGFENLSNNAQGALISLGYNRGYGMSGDSRREMREIRDLVPKKDYAGIAKQIRLMERIWKGTTIEKGMTRRREAEAKLVETP